MQSAILIITARIHGFDGGLSCSVYSMCLYIHVGWYLVNVCVRYIHCPLQTTGAKSAYVPTISYACDLHSSNDQSCRGDVPAINVVIGVVLVVLGLTLCFVGHNFFHAGTCTCNCSGQSRVYKPVVPKVCMLYCTDET